MYLPLGLFGASIGTAVLPAVSRNAAADDTAGIRETLSRGLAMMLLVNVPATLGLVTLATPIVRLLFERGLFLEVDTDATAAAVRMYACGLVGYSAARIASPTFYALGLSRVPVLVSAATIGLNVLLSITLVRLLGFSGLALSTSIAALANGTVLVWLLWRHLGGLEGRSLALVLVKIVLSAAVMGASAVAIDALMGRLAPGAHFIAQAIRLTASIGGALVVLALTAKLLRLAEFNELQTMVQRRVRKLLSG
jgi:putative peptidoglycan lipid II flippase